MQDTCVPSLSCEDPLEEEMATHSSTRVENPMDRVACQAIVQCCKVLDMTEVTLHSTAHIRWGGGGGGPQSFLDHRTVSGAAKRTAHRSKRCSEFLNRSTK